MQEYVRQERGIQPAPLDDDEIDLLQLFGTLWRGKFVIAFCATIATLIGGYYAFVVAEPKYAAATTLALDITGSQMCPSSEYSGELGPFCNGGSGSVSV